MADGDAVRRDGVSFYCSKFARFRASGHEIHAVGVLHTPYILRLPTVKLERVKFKYGVLDTCISVPNTAPAARVKLDGG